MQDLISWKDFKKNRSLNVKEYEITNILCPCCDERLYKNKKVAYASMPLKYEYKCFNCSWEADA